MEKEINFIYQYSKRQSVLKFEGYVLNVVELMDDHEPQHIDDFRTHSRELFFLLNEHSNKLQRNGHGPQVLPDKQLQVAMWYIANIAKMREMAHIFGLSMTTVYGRCL